MIDAVECAKCGVKFYLRIIGGELRDLNIFCPICGRRVKKGDGRFYAKGDGKKQGGENA
jgi:PHP family Zn ribbon phosphoesterase